MRLVQNVIVLCGLLLIALINILPDLFYVGGYRSMGEEAVRVYEVTSVSDGPALPVLHMEGDGRTTDTGQRVHVDLRNDYRDQHLLAKPNLTLLLIGVLAALYLFSGVMARFTEPHRPA